MQNYVSIVIVTTWTSLFGLCSAQNLSGDNANDGILTGIAWTGDGSGTGGTNPARSGLERNTSFYVRLWGHEPFGIPEIRAQGIVLSGLVGPVGLAGSAWTQGFDALSILNLSAIASVPLSSSDQPVRAGLTLRSRKTSVSYGKAEILYGIITGLHIELAERFSLGSTVGKWISSEGFEASLGFQFQVSETVLLLMEADRTAGYATDLRLGADIGLAESFRVRVSMASEPRVLMIGLLFKTSGLSSTVTIQRHYLLGMSRAIGVALSL